MCFSHRFFPSFILISVFCLFLFSMSNSLFAQEIEQNLSITVKSTPIRPGEPIALEFHAGPGNPKDWIGLFKAGASDGDYIEWQYLDGLSEESLIFNPVEEEGTFQFRGFTDDSMELIGKSEIFEVRKISVEVTGWADKTAGYVTLSIPENWQSTPPGEEMFG